MKLKKQLKYVFPYCLIEIVDTGRTRYFRSIDAGALEDDQLKELFGRKVKSVSGSTQHFGDLTIELYPVNKTKKSLKKVIGKFSSKLGNRILIISDKLKLNSLF